MREGNEKYNKLLGTLKKSKPELADPGRVRDAVLSAIKSREMKLAALSRFPDYLFAWVKLPWLRRSLVTASAVLVIFFIYQQIVIIRGIKELNTRTIINGSELLFTPVNNHLNRIMLNRLTGRSFDQGDCELNREQFEILIRSYNELCKEYGDLIRIIERDPELLKKIKEEIAKGQDKESGI